MSNISPQPEFEDCLGQWWRPDNPLDRFPGALRRDQVGGVWVLTLMRDGAGTDDLRHGVVESGTTFFGRTTAGDVTVLDASLGGWRQGSRPGEGVDSLTTTQTWTAFHVILNGHFEGDTRWQSIDARIPHAWHWYSSTVLEPGTRPDLTTNFYEELKCVYSDIEIALWRGSGSSVSGTEHHYTGEAGYRFERPTGLTFGDVEQIVLALNNLHCVLFGGATSTDVLTLRGTASDALRTVKYVHGAPAQVPDIGVRDPFVGTSNVTFTDFLPRWISLHTKSQTWPTLGPPGDVGGWLQTDTLAAVAALEAIGREHVVTAAATPPMHDVILRAAIKGGITSDPTRYLRNLLDREAKSLPEVLVEVASGLGDQSAQWLLGPSIRDWANTAAYVRNSLAHGPKASASLKLEPDVLIAVLLTTRAILRLTLVRLAGYAAPHATDAGETLVNPEGNLSVQHRDSALVAQLRDARQSRDAWSRWAKRLHAQAPSGE